MSPTCAKFDELTRHVDPEVSEELARHAEECATCSARLDEWRALSVVAKTLHASWESPDLWNRIADGLNHQRERDASKPRWSTLMQAAALLVVVVGLGAILLRAPRPNTATRSDQDRWREWVLRESALEEVERSEALHLASIERLEAIAAPELEKADTPLMLSYREKLLLLDEAIDECRAQIDQNQYNTHLRRQLLAMYSQKDETLREVLEEEHVR